MLDDERFAKLYATSRIQSRGLGKSIIRRELAQKGVSASNVVKAMESIADVDEHELARELAKRRLGSMKGISPDAKKRRLHGALMRKGFSTNVIFKVLSEVLGANNEEWE